MSWVVYDAIGVMLLFQAVAETLLTSRWANHIPLAVGEHVGGRTCAGRRTPSVHLGVPSLLLPALGWPRLGVSRPRIPPGSILRDVCWGGSHLHHLSGAESNLHSHRASCKLCYRPCSGPDATSQRVSRAWAGPIASSCLIRNCGRQRIWTARDCPCGCY